MISLHRVYTRLAPMLMTVPVAIYLGLALWGFTIGSGEAILGFLPVDTGDNLFHLLLGALGVAAALSTPGAKKKKGEPVTA